MEEPDGLQSMGSHRVGHDQVAHRRQSHSTLDARHNMGASASLSIGDKARVEGNHCPPLPSSLGSCSSAWAEFMLDTKPEGSERLSF